MFNRFDASNYPEEIPAPIAEAQCRVFGHLCPVFFVGEPLIGNQGFAVGRSVDPAGGNRLKSSVAMARLSACFEPVPDDQDEFDHVIPFSKGGATTADNLKLCCRNCNRKKSNSLKDILSPNPIERPGHFAKTRERLTKPCS